MRATPDNDDIAAASASVPFPHRATGAELARALAGPASHLALLPQLERLLLELHPALALGFARRWALTPAQLAAAHDHVAAATGLRNRLLDRALDGRV